MKNNNQFPIKVTKKNADGEVEIIDAVLEVGDGKDVLCRLIVNEEDTK